MAKSKKQKDQIAYIRIQEDDHAKLKALSERTLLSSADIIRSALRNWIEKQPIPKSGKQALKVSWIKLPQADYKKLVDISEGTAKTFTAISREAIADYLKSVEA